MNDYNTNWKEVLDSIPVDDLSYDEWFRIGCALKNENQSFNLWDAWSSKGSKYHPEEMESKWESFNDEGLNGGTIIYIAREHGYMPSSEYQEEGGYWKMDMTGDFTGTLTWIDDPDFKLVDKSWIKGDETFKEPSDYNWNPSQELITYLRTLFNDSDYFGYVNQSIAKEKNGKTKYIPGNAGVYSRTVGDIIDKLQQYNSVELALGSYDKNAGIWGRVNALDGLGVKQKENVIDYKYTLVESDDMPLGEQITLLKELNLPIATMVYSGKKSVHAIVKVNATGIEQYKERVNFIQKVLEQNGFHVDEANRDAARMTRIPGVYRGEHKQFLIDTNLGASNYDEWVEWVSAEMDDLPDPVDMDDIWDNLPPRKPELIEGILRETHIMNLSGSSKTGKTYLMQELALAIATGNKWLGHQCSQGEVLYIDAEVDKSSSLNNINEVAKAKGYTREMVGKNLIIWNIRGYATQIQKLLPSIVRRFKKRNLKLIIIDPMYKINEGDENSAKDMSTFTRGLDQLSVTLNCAIAYVHHFSKGNQSDKDSIDRASGSGVIGRHGDALLSVSRLNAKNKEDESMIPLRLEGTVREFAPLEPINMWFKHPIHILDEDGELAYAKIGVGKNSGESKLMDIANLFNTSFDSIAKLNPETNRYEASQPDVLKLMHENDKHSKSTYKSYRTNFYPQYKELLRSGLTDVLKEDKKKGDFDPALFYKMNDADEYYY